MKTKADSKQEWQQQTSLQDPIILPSVEIDSRQIQRCRGLFGRDEERDQLMSAYQHAIHTKEHKSNVVVVSGPAGSGKTALVDGLRDQLKRDRGHLFYWKFDRNMLLQVAPNFSAAMKGFLRGIVEDSSEEELEAIRQQLSPSLSPSQVQVLTSQFPALKTFVFNSEDETRQSQDKEYAFDFSAYRVFMRSVCALDFPVVCFFDDVQWIDVFYGLLTCTNLAQDVRIPSFLLVLSYNSDLEDTESQWHNDIVTLRDKDCINITEINLQCGLDQRATEAMVADMLDSPVEGVSHISSWVHDRTRGNPLFVEELLFWLFDFGCLKGLPTHEFAEDGLLWSLDKAQAESQYWDGSRADVTACLASKLKWLPLACQEVLKVAACLGYRFNPELVASALSISDTTDFLEKANAANVVEKNGADRSGKMIWRFAHNSMQEAALSLIDADGRDELDLATFHLAIGRNLLTRLGEDELKNNILTMLGQIILGQSAITMRSEKYKFAALALRAAQASVSLSSFFSARKCIGFAVNMLRQEEGSCWQEHYDLSLAVYNVAAEVAYAMGQFQLVDEMVDAVLKGSKTFEDRLTALATKIYMFASTRRFAKACEMAMPLLRDLGFTFPALPNRRHVFSQFMVTRRLLNGKSDEAILRSNPMTDDRMIAANRIMNSLLLAAFYNHPMLAPLLAMRMVQSTVKDGISAFSCVAFGWYGAFLCRNGWKVEEGTRFGNLSLKLLDRFKSKQFLPRVYAVYYGIIHSWTRPKAEAIEPTLKGYYVGNETGDIELSTTNINICLFMSFECRPLSVLERQWEGFMRDTNVKHLSSSIKAFDSHVWLLRSLLGREVGDIDGDVDERGWKQNCKTLLFFLLGDFKGSVMEGRKVQQLDRDMPVEGALASIYYFANGLANIALLKLGSSTHARRLRNTARKQARRLDLVAKTSPDNALAKLTLLEAEFSSMSPRKSHNATVRKYMMAVALAESNKSNFEAAIAHERYGHYLLEDNDS